MFSLHVNFSFTLIIIVKNLMSCIATTTQQDTVSIKMKVGTNIIIVNDIFITVDKILRPLDYWDI